MNDRTSHAPPLGMAQVSVAPLVSAVVLIALATANGQLPAFAAASAAGRVDSDIPSNHSPTSLR
jgi:hypothetical protein